MVAKNPTDMQNKHTNITVSDGNNENMENKDTNENSNRNNTNIGNKNQ